MRSKKIEIKKNIEKAFNEGLKEYTQDEAYINLNLIPLENGNVVNAEELKKNINDLIDGMVAKEIKSINFRLEHGGCLDFSMLLSETEAPYVVKVGK